MASTLAVDSIILPSRPAVVEELAPPSYALARTSLIATLLAAPLAFGVVQEWAWGALAVMAFSLFLLWSIDGVRQGRLRIFWSPLYLPAGLFFLLGMIQFAGHLTMDRTATRESLLKLSTDLIFFFLAGQLFCGPASEPPPLIAGATRGVEVRVAREKNDILSACPVRFVIVAYTFSLALFAIFQFFSSQGLIYWMVKGPGWTFGPYVNHNHYAGLMEMLIPLNVASVLPALRKNPSALLLGFAALIPIASLLLSGSRGGFISLVAEVFLAAALVFFCGSRRARKPTALAGGAALLAAALLFFWMAPRHIAERLAMMGDATQPPEVEMGNRLVAARDSLGILRDHPWLGAGLGSFETAFPPYQSFPTDLRWDHAHNDYAEALAETGLAGGALIACALGMFFRLALKGVVRSRESGVRSRRGGGLGIGDWGLGIKAGVRSQESGVSSAASTLLPNLESRVPCPVSRTPYPESRVPNPESAAYCPLPTAYCLRIAAALGCCGLLVHSFLDFNLHIPANAAWFAVCAAIATSGRQQAEGSRQWLVGSRGGFTAPCGPSTDG
jgi:O-antigen ligase